MNWTAGQADCVARGGHLISSRQQYMGEAGVLNAASRRWPNPMWLIGGSRGEEDRGLKLRPGSGWQCCAPSASLFLPHKEPCCIDYPPTGLLVVAKCLSGVAVGPVTPVWPGGSGLSLARMPLRLGSFVFTATCSNNWVWVDGTDPSNLNTLVGTHIWRVSGDM